MICATTGATTRATDCQNFCFHSKYIDLAACLTGAEVMFRSEESAWNSSPSAKGKGQSCSRPGRARVLHAWFNNEKGNLYLRSCAAQQTIQISQSLHPERLRWQRRRQPRDPWKGRSDFWQAQSRSWRWQSASQPRKSSQGQSFVLYIMHLRKVNELAPAKLRQQFAYTHSEQHS